MNRISIQLKESSQPITHEYDNTYEKGSFFCVYDGERNVVYKYPIENIFRVVENYGYHGSLEGLPKDAEAEVPADLGVAITPKKPTGHTTTVVGGPLKTPLSVRFGIGGETRE